MQVMIVVVNDSEHVVPILDRLVEIGISGATVIDSMGMASLVGDHVPFFSRLARMDGEHQSNKTLFTVVRDDQLHEVAGAIDDILGGVDRPDSGFMFAVPVTLCRGLQACDLSADA